MGLQVLAGDDASSSSGDSDFGDKVTASLRLVVAVPLLLIVLTLCHKPDTESLVQFALSGCEQPKLLLASIGHLHPCFHIPHDKKLHALVSDT